MADHVRSVSERLSVKKTISKTCTLKTINKVKRNKKKLPRRTKSKKWKHLRTQRKLKHQKNKQSSSCATLSVYNVANMECAATNGYSQLPQEVSDWQYYHQLAYWKSRAISLEFENKMLHAHIKKMCTKEIQDYVEVVSAQENIRHNCNNESQTKTIHSKPNDREDASTSEEDCSKDNIDVKKLYGDNEKKIKGIETAVEINYRMQVENKKPPMWPNIPLNM